MKQYKTVNNLVGWITFLIAATVYCMTIEPTASFWDCPEYPVPFLEHHAPGTQTCGDRRKQYHTRTDGHHHG